MGKVKTISKLAAWDAYTAYVVPNNVKSKGGPEYAGRFNVKLRFERKPQYYISNIFLVTCGILVASLLPLGMEPQEIGDRMSVYASGMLTLVAFKYGVSEQLPSVPYSTVSDVFLMAQIATLVFAMAEALLGYKLEKHEILSVDTVTLIDNILLAVLGLLWTLRLAYVAVYRRKIRRSWTSV